MATSSNGTLNALIPNIQGISRDLLDLQRYVPDEAQVIAALVDELQDIIACLRDIQGVSSDLRYYLDARRYAPDVNDVTKAIRQTLKDLDGFLQSSRRFAGSNTTAPYRAIWQNIEDFFEEQSKCSLLHRLRVFRAFLEELYRLLYGNRETPEYERLHMKILRLLDWQNDDILAANLREFELSRVPAAPPQPTKVKSWERKRPGTDGHPPPVVPQAPPAAFAGGGGGGVGGAGHHPHHHRPGPSSPISPPGSGRLFEHPPELVRPITPPGSSTFTNTSSVSSAPSSAGSMMKDHWLLAAFAQSRPQTPFHSSEAESRLWANHMSGITRQLQQKGYKELLILSFDNSLELKVFVRERDYKAQIYCKQDQRGKKVVSCLPVTGLHIHRTESNLKLCKLNKKGKLELWVTLRLVGYERLTLLFCALLALRQEDNSMQNLKLKNHIMKGEECVFDCHLMDNGFEHALQIFKDSHSDGIRLTASVLRGPMKRTPVWTAFINYKIASLDWIKRKEPKKIHLGDLPRYIFLTGYTPQMGPNGEHELFFRNAKNADEFEKVIEQLAEKEI